MHKTSILRLYWKNTYGNDPTRPTRQLHPSKCPEALRPLWAKKREAYLRSGRWKMSSARNTCPMLLLTKPGTGIRDIPPRLRTVFDLRERNYSENCQSVHDSEAERALKQKQ